MKIPVYIFSYNRLRYLKNLIDSVEKFYPYSTIYIVDDGSDEIEMLSFIERNQNKYHFILPNGEQCLDRGGLYYNLNYCINHAATNNYEHVLFAVDDLQVVRSVSENEISKDIQFLSDNSSSIFCIAASFLPLSEKFVGIEGGLHVKKDYYLPNDEFESGVYRFSESGFFSVENFIKLMGKFENSENLNQQKCKERNLLLAHACFPIGGRLPFQEYRRRGRDKRAIALLNQVSKRGFYPFEEMTETQVGALFAREKSQLAYAEKWLHAPGVQQTIWSFWGESFGVELLGGEDEKKLAEKLFLIENNIKDHSTADKMIIDLCETYLEDKKNSLYSYN